MSKGREPIVIPGYIFSNPVFRRENGQSIFEFQYNDEQGNRKKQNVNFCVIEGKIQMVENVPVECSVLA